MDPEWILSVLEICYHQHRDIDLSGECRVSKSQNVLHDGEVILTGTMCSSLILTYIARYSYLVNQLLLELAI